MARLTPLRAVLALTLAAWTTPAAAGSALEGAIKAAYLYKLAPFVTWPASALPEGAGPFRICVVGADPFDGALEDVVRGQRAQGHAIMVRRMASIGAEGAATCHIMFVTGGPTQPFGTALRAATGLPVLTVTDRSRGVPGGMIEFVMQQGHVRFVIHKGMAEASGLQISSKLLAVAVEVKP
jgi:hypothetical protein